MIVIKNITGYRKILFNLQVKIYVFFVFLPRLIKGEITFRRFVLFLRRLLVFLAKTQHNKFLKIGELTRLDLYVPGFPSKAFKTACQKFWQFDNQLPCTTVLISVTSACSYHCSHCYQKLDKGKDVDLELLISAVRKLQEMGIAFFNIEGGEPFLVYDRLKKLCSSIDDRSEIWINSTGKGMTGERLQELKKLNVTAVMFSLHSVEPDKFNQFMGCAEAWDNLTSGIKMCHEAGIAVAFNTCLMKDDFYNGNFESIMEKAKEFKACLIQIIKPKPAGAWLEKEDIAFTAEDIKQVISKVNKYNLSPEFASYPSISAQIIEESKEVFGCTAGGIDRFYINAKGDVQPCEFLNVSFGNIAEDDFENIYQKMRLCFAWAGDCALCEKYSPEIRKEFKENNLTSLPLPLEQSEKIYSSWKRGNKTDLYEKIEKLK